LLVPDSINPSPEVIAAPVTKTSFDAYPNGTLVTHVFVVELKEVEGIVTVLSAMISPLGSATVESTLETIPEKDRVPPENNR
jgi:hypothetical protein